MTANQNDEEVATAIANRIQLYTGLLQAQVQQAGGWPAKLVFPEPSSEIEREA